MFNRVKDGIAWPSIDERGGNSMMTRSFVRCGRSPNTPTTKIKKRNDVGFFSAPRHLYVCTTKRAVAHDWDSVHDRNERPKTWGTHRIMMMMYVILVVESKCRFVNNTSFTSTCPTSSTQEEGVVYIPRTRWLTEVTDWVLSVF